MKEALTIYFIIFLTGSIMLKFSLPKMADSKDFNPVLFSVGGLSSCFAGACLFMIIVPYIIEIVKRIILH